MADIHREALLDAARAVRKRAYAPYSRFKIGAAVLGENGKIYTGVNIENASYGATVCAERTALLVMVSDGCQKYLAMAVAGGMEEDAAPCMICRQVMTEFCNDLDAPLYFTGPSGRVYDHTLRELAPLPFMAFDPNPDYEP